MERLEYDYAEPAPRPAHRRRHRQNNHHHDVPNRRGMLAAIGAIALLSSWAGGASLYILFNDEALKYLAERQVSITRSYETQAATLQAEVERLRSLKLIDQERVDRAVSDLARRQTAIEARQSAITALAAEKRDITGAIPAEATPPQAKPASRPSPLSDTIMISPPNDRWGQLRLRSPEADAAERYTEDSGSAEDRIGDLARSTSRIELAQGDLLNEIEAGYSTRKQRIRGVLDELGFAPNRIGRNAGLGLAPANAAMGGPLLPWSRAPEDPFARQIQRIRTTAAALRALEQEIDVLPVRRPALDDADVTSGYGVRLDPFIRQPALHTGIDFRGETGDPVRATAGGQVVQAERNGGYGLMIEIDHGNGFATRYAHLSSIVVTEGSPVAAGQMIGRIGSTGRSTGPHLHYEVRLNGDPTDPQRFLRAGLRLTGED